MGTEDSLAGVFHAMAASPAFLEFANIVVPVTQVLIGVALFTSAFARLAAGRAWWGHADVDVLVTTTDWYSPCGGSLAVYSEEDVTERRV